MKIKHSHPSMKHETWHLSLADAPKIVFPHGKRNAPTSVTVAKITYHDKEPVWHMQFVAPDDRLMGLYSSQEGATFPITDLPPDFAVALFKECR